MIALLLALSGSPITDLAAILECGTAEVPAAVCCKHVEAARKTANAEARKILDRWLKRNCREQR